MEDNSEPKFTTVMVCFCARCGHKWNSKNNKRPIACARCRSRNWWLKAGELKLHTPKLPKQPKPQKYGLDKMEIGQVGWLPNLLNEKGEVDRKANTSRNLSIRRYERSSGMKFFTNWGYKDSNSVLWIKRIA